MAASASEAESLKALDRRQAAFEAKVNKELAVLRSELAALNDLFKQVRDAQAQKGRS